MVFVAVADVVFESRAGVVYWRDRPDVVLWYSNLNPPDANYDFSAAARTISFSGSSRTVSFSAPTRVS